MQTISSSKFDLGKDCTYIKFILKSQRVYNIPHLYLIFFVHIAIRKNNLHVDLCT